MYSAAEFPYASGRREFAVKLDISLEMALATFGVLRLKDDVPNVMFLSKILESQETLPEEEFGLRRVVEVKQKFLPRWNLGVSGICFGVGASCIVTSSESESDRFVNPFAFAQT